MEKAELLDALFDIEKKGLRLSTKSFECGTHCNSETTLTMRKADEDFADAILNLRAIIIA